MYDDEEIDFTKLKYVLYARKSTDDPQRQVRSIPDQIAECESLAERLGIKIITILQETKSAKAPNKRPVFKQMLVDLRKGIYDGILAWNPDRLARNMKEGGEIIDMVDEGFIKDLKFVTHHFSKDANGKMLLGMAFVLSKQYSDNLSQNVTRGVRKNFLEGKSPAPKHGYYRDEEGLHRPDDKNFELIIKAWEMRSEGTSIVDITDYMNTSDYGRLTKKGKVIKMTKQILSDIFKDPFYYGILVQRNQSVDLREIYSFEPATTEALYIKVQGLEYRRMKPNKPHKTNFYPLKMMIVCSFCQSNMYTGPSTGKAGQRYLNYRCDNKFCIRNSQTNRNKAWNDATRVRSSIRAKVVFDFIYRFLDEGLNFTEKEYNEYYNSLAKQADNVREKLRIEVHSKQGKLKYIDAEITERSLSIIKLEKGSVAWKVNEDRISTLSEEQIELYIS